MEQRTCARRVTHRSWSVDVEQIERARILKGWTRRQLGDASKVDRKTLNNMCNGRRRPQLGTLQAVCRALGLGLADVIAFDPDPMRTTPVDASISRDA
jgi:transcriptional regulator with XRE-family HTH domain